MIRLDKQVPKNPDQLDLFSPQSETHTSTDNESTHVPKLTDTSPNNDTPPVSKSGHLIKHTNNKQERETPTHEIFKRNKKIQDAINDMGSVPKSIHMPVLAEVEKFFTDTNYPIAEAKKFFNHYKAIGWKIQGKTPIEDWKALVEKWMSNATRWEDKKQQQPTSDPMRDIQYLFESFVDGKKIFQHVTVEHFEQLKLQLSDEVMQQAWKERINQVSGTNQHSLNQLWQAYLTGDPNNELAKKDQPNLITLAKRLAVIKQFQQLKQNGKSKLQ